MTGVNHNTVIRWVRKSVLSLPNAPEVAEIPEITEIDELQTYVGQKKQNLAMERAHYGAIAPSSPKETGEALPLVSVPCSARSDASASR